MYINFCTVYFGLLLYHLLIFFYVHIIFSNILHLLSSISKYMYMYVFLIKIDNECQINTIILNLGFSNKMHPAEFFRYFFWMLWKTHRISATIQCVSRSIFGVKVRTKQFFAIILFSFGSNWNESYYKSWRPWNSIKKL